jgi:hypothetical protein
MGGIPSFVFWKNATCPHNDKIIANNKKQQRRKMMVSVISRLYSQQAALVERAWVKSSGWLRDPSSKSSVP